MPLESDVFTALNGATAAGDKVYPAPAEQGTAAPYLTWQRVGSSPVTSLAGSSGLDQVRLQVDAWHTSRLGARALAAAVRTAMEAQAFKALLVSDADDYEPETRLYRVVLDFRLWDRPA